MRHLKHGGKGNEKMTSSLERKRRETVIPAIPYVLSKRDTKEKKAENEVLSIRCAMEQRQNLEAATKQQAE